MKKFLIISILIILFIALLPLVGNKIVEDELKNRIELLTSYGVKVQNSATDSNYFSTKRHYEFLLSDAEKFMEYLNQYSDTQLPPYVNAMLHGTVIGIDIHYSNFPLSDSVSVDIYPLSLSSEIAQNIKKSDFGFYNYLKTLLESKGVLYHIDYNILNREFNGYIKDIKEGHLLEDNSKITLNISKALYDGEGALIAPTKLNASADLLGFKVEKPKELFSADLKGFRSSSIFESETTYASSIMISDIEFLVKESSFRDTLLQAKNIKVNLSSNTQGAKAEFYAKSSFEDFKLQTDSAKIRASDFNYDISLSEVDKDSFEELRILMAKAKTNSTDELQAKMEQSIYKIMSKGVIVTLADFSVEKIGAEDKEAMKGFSIKANIILAEDANMTKNIRKSPLLLAKNLTVDAKIKISKEIFAFVNEKAPMSSLAKMYAKEEGEVLVFDIKYDKGELNINGKGLQ
ncbi:YdgA family protein [bacterium]|nr:YdgA family protein [bacterium]MBU1989516.1 YdgA family protein [bacterium]